MKSITVIALLLLPLAAMAQNRNGRRPTLKRSRTGSHSIFRKGVVSVGAMATILANVSLSALRIKVINPFLCNSYFYARRQEILAPTITMGTLDTTE
jgi:hypothetical protein